MLLEVIIKNKTCRNFYYPDSLYNKEDSGFDIYFPENISIPGNSTVLVDMGCIFSLKNDCGKRLPFYIYPRSSIYKTSLRMSNSVGIIDKNYNGNIKIAIDNISSENYMIESGTRYFQICSGDLTPIDFMTLASENSLIDTSRGEGGFGSSGNK